MKNLIFLISLLFLIAFNTFAKEEELKTKCSENITEACLALGFLYERGIGREKDIQKAMKFYDKACKLNNAVACSSLGSLYKKEKDYQKAIKFYDKACKLNNAVACSSLGSLYEKEKDYQKAIKFYNKACKLNDAFACLDLGSLYEKEKDYQKAIEFYDKACKLNNAAGCFFSENVKKLQSRNSIPKPFGLVVGVTTQKEFLQIIKQKKWDISNEGYRIIKGDISNPNVYGYIVKNIKLDKLSTAKFWFYKGKLMKIDYIFYEDMNKSTFKLYYDKLKAKYGNPSKYTEPYLAEGLAEWSFGTVKIQLSVPWVSKYTYLSYYNVNLVNAADKDDKEYYQIYIKETSKNMEGL